MNQEDQKIRVLIAESRSDVRSALRLFLEQDFDNIAVTAASKATDLPSQVAGCCPDLMLLDWELPDLKPVELITQMRDCCTRIQIIASSGRSEVRQHALECGVDAFVSKSETPERMIETIKQLLSLKERRKL